MCYPKNPLRVLYVLFQRRCRLIIPEQVRDIFNMVLGKYRDVQDACIIDEIILSQLKSHPSPETEPPSPMTQWAGEEEGFPSKAPPPVPPPLPNFNVSSLKTRKSPSVKTRSPPDSFGSLVADCRPSLLTVCRYFEATARTS